MERSSRTATLAAFMLSVGIMFHAVAALAADPVPAEPEWDAKLIGYGWLASIHADVDAGPVETTVDVRIDDLIDKITWVVMAGLQVRYHQVLFDFDGLGLQVQEDVGGRQRTQTFAPAGGALGGIVARVGPADAGLRFTTVMGEGTLGYRALSLPLSTLFSGGPPDDPKRFRLDLLGGARYWYFRTKVRLSIPPASITAGGVPAPPALFPRIRDRFGRTRIPRTLLIGGSQDVFTKVTSFTDAILGVRVGMDVSETVSVALRSDIGGFGLGDSSNFSWQVLPSVEWRFAENWSFDAAYRAIGVDKGAVSEGILYGLALGVGYRF